MGPSGTASALITTGFLLLLRLGYRLFVKPAVRVAADVVSALVEVPSAPIGPTGGAAAPGTRRPLGRDWWTTTILASAVCLALGFVYVGTVWPAAVLWFAIALVLPVRGVSEGLTLVPYFLLTAVLLSSVPVAGWWLAGASVAGAVFEAACAAVRWVRRRSAARQESAPQEPARQEPASQESAQQEPARQA